MFVVIVCFDLVLLTIYNNDNSNSNSNNNNNYYYYNYNNIYSVQFNSSLTLLSFCLSTIYNMIYIFIYDLVSFDLSLLSWAGTGQLLGNFDAFI